MTSTTELGHLGPCPKPVRLVATDPAPTSSRRTRAPSAKARILPEATSRREVLLQVVEGSVDIEVVTDEGSEITTVAAGSVFVVPRGHWHRHRHTRLVKELHLTPGLSNMSFEEDPRIS
jgi:hypothetical protein